MEHSKLNLQSSDFSLLQPTDSQILAFSCSLSIPSEPPDLKNWFPSYQYESPVLNSNSLSDEFVTRKNERDEKDEVFVVRKKQNPKAVVKCGSSSGNQHENQCFSKIRGSLESPSFLSEPTDIRNWFSSYVYESSYLDTTNGFGDSCKEGKHEKDEFLVENSSREREGDLGDCSENRSGSEEVFGERVQSEGLAKCNSSWRDDKQERQPVSETPGPFESPSILSEPTDIRNWFSSYAYESPSLGTTDGFGDSVCKENICEIDGILVENSNRERKEDLEDFSKNRSDNEEDVGDKVQSEGLVKCNSSWRDNKQERQPVSEGGPNAGVNDLLPGQNDLHLEHIPETLQNNGTSPAKDVQKSRLDKEGSQCKPEEEFFHGTTFMLPNNQRSACSNDGKSPPNLIYGRDFILKESSEAKVHAAFACSPQESDSELIPVNGESVRKSTHGSKDRKDDGKEISENGFSTTKKGKLTRKSNKSSLEVQQENSKGTVPFAGGKDADVKRKALADATNFHHSPVMEITGKWKCPQKSKPYQGPPLKQLRLGKWFHKL